jgi:hypothetical protein
MRTYVKQVEKDPSKYDGEKIIKMLDDFGEILNVHLNDEIDTLEPEKMHKIFKSEDEAQEVIDEMVKWTLERVTMTRSIVFVISLSGIILILGDNSS